MPAQRILQNSLLVWLDGNVSKIDERTEITLDILRTVNSNVRSFSKIGRCVDFIEEVEKEKVLVITSGFLGRDLVEQIHDMKQVHSIYVYCKNSARHKFWIDQWPKIRGFDDRIESICDLLRPAVRESNEDLIPMSFVNNDENDESKMDLNRLEPSFMYTTLFKRILLKIEHEPNEKEAIVKFCQKQHANSFSDLKIIEEFDRDYQAEKAIWWYTRECFIYNMLNRALRLLESDIIIDMGFFIHDIHLQLERLYKEQYDGYKGPPIIVYRGQGLSISHFTTLKKSKGGLLAFNSFLSTSTVQIVSFGFAQQHSFRENMVGVLFEMTLDPKLNTTPFANVDHYSFYNTEKEILFSMNSVFRIDDVVELKKGKQLFQVNLTLTSDNDPKLREITDQIEQDINIDSGWGQLARMLVKIGSFDKAEDMYLALLSKTTKRIDQQLYYSKLGEIKNEQGDYSESLRYYRQMLAIQEELFPPDHLVLATSYNDMAILYKDMGNNSKALIFYNKSLAIREKKLAPDDPALAVIYNNLGVLHREMGKNTKALSFYEKALSIEEKILPENHPDLGIAYNNISLAYNSSFKYEKAFEYCRKALEIRKDTLPPDHPLIAQSYNNLAFIYGSSDNQSESLVYYNKALEIQERVLPENHPDLAQTYNNMAWVYLLMEDDQQGVKYFEKTLAIQEKSLPSDHPRLKETRRNVLKYKKNSSL